MDTYIRFIYFNYLKSIVYVFSIMLCLVVILNILSEVEFFKNYEVSSFLPFYLALLNSFDLMFEILPFVFLISTQFFFVNLFTDSQINIFKYSGLKNSKIIILLSLFSFFLGIFIITIFYSFSSNLKNLYLEYKNLYTTDNKYLAVITKNGLWIKDIINQKKIITNAIEIENNFLKNVTINEFDDSYNLIKITKSQRVDIKSNQWKLYDVKVFQDNITKEYNYTQLFSNFNYEKINSLFSNLSSLSILELIKLRENYKQISYSTIEIDVQLQKLATYPIYFTLMTILSAIIMFNTKGFKSTSLKIIIGLFFCVVIYYFNNLFYVLGNSEKISTTSSVWVLIIILFFANLTAMLNINDK